MNSKPRVSQLAAVILAAGRSTRLGRPKQLLRLDGETLLARATRLAHEAGCAPCFVVYSEEALLPHIPANTAPLLNPDPEQGIASSIVIGVTAAQTAAAGGVLILACDQPALTAAHLRALTADPTRLTASAYANRRGIPAYFPASTFAPLLTLTGDTGARTLLATAHTIPNESLALDIDTEADLAQARTFFGEVR